jgi:hypothetical protein
MAKYVTVEVVNADGTKTRQKIKVIAPAHWLDSGDRRPAVVADTFAFSLEGSRVRGNVARQ